MSRKRCLSWLRRHNVTVLERFSQKFYNFLTDPRNSRCNRTSWNFLLLIMILSSKKKNYDIYIYIQYNVYCSSENTVTSRSRCSNREKSSFCLSFLLFRPTPILDLYIRSLRWRYHGRTCTGKHKKRRAPWENHQPLNSSTDEQARLSLFP